MNPLGLKILIGLLAIAILGFGGYQTYKILAKPTTPKTATKPVQVNLTDYLANSSTTVKLSVIGPVTAPETHVEQTFSITSNTRDLWVYKAYGTDPVFSYQYRNNQAAFQDFLVALQNAGFTKISTSPTPSSNAAGLTSPEDGVCPTGKRMVYEVQVDGKSLMRSWSSSCSATPGNFGGQSAAILSLFQKQIPELSKLPGELRP
jgi:hypothetical protein